MKKISSRKLEMWELEILPRAYQIVIFTINKKNENIISNYNHLGNTLFIKNMINYKIRKQNYKKEEIVELFHCCR